jgi:hypothetical protein
MIYPLSKKKILTCSWSVHHKEKSHTNNIYINFVSELMMKKKRLFISKVFSSCFGSETCTFIRLELISNI